MLRALHDLVGRTIAAEDGDIGAIDAFLFDDRHWTVRHVVVDLGRWLPGRRVLLSPVLVAAVDDKRVSVRTTKDKIRNSPDIDTDKPVSRQHEIALYSYYGYQPYWLGGGLWGPAAYPAALLAPPPPAAAAFTAAAHPELGPDEDETADPHLRSTREVAGYHLCTNDGEVGHVDDFVIDEHSWAIEYLVVDTSNWPGGRTVLVPASWVRDIDWSRMQLTVHASAQDVASRPAYPRRDANDSSPSIG